LFFNVVERCNDRPGWVIGRNALAGIICFLTFPFFLKCLGIGGMICRNALAGIICFLTIPQLFVALEAILSRNALAGIICFLTVRSSMSPPNPPRRNALAGIICFLTHIAQ
jgi:hypothetical protein